MSITKWEPTESMACFEEVTIAGGRNCEKEKALPVTRLEEELQSCMKCQYFYGNNHQCIMHHCVKEKKKQDEAESLHSCYKCPYRISDRYCFPCMRKLRGG